VVMTSTRNLSRAMIQRHFASIGENRNQFAHFIKHRETLGGCR
jgi:hypothetical protein